MYETYSPHDAAPLGDLPGMPPIDLTETNGGLKYVRSDIRPSAIQVIGTMTQFVMDPNGMGATTSRGTAVPMVAMPGSVNWVTTARQTSKAVLVKQGTSTIDVIITLDPAVIAANAGALMGGQYAVLDGAPGTLASASAQSGSFPGGVEPGVPTVPGGVPGLPGWPSIPPIPNLPPVPGGVPLPGPVPGPLPYPPAASTSEKKLPSWVVPVVVGAGALAVVGVVVASRKKRMTANKRRRHNRR